MYSEKTAGYCGNWLVLRCLSWWARARGSDKVLGLKIAGPENGVKASKEATESAEKERAPILPAPLRMGRDGQAAEQESAWQSACRPQRRQLAHRLPTAGPTPIPGSLSIPPHGRLGR